MTLLTYFSCDEEQLLVVTDTGRLLWFQHLRLQQLNSALEQRDLELADTVL